MNREFEEENILIDQYRKVKESIIELEMLYKDYPESLTDFQKEQLYIGRESIQKITSKLESLKGYPLTQKKVEIVAEQIRAIIEKLKPNYYGFKISTSQGLMFETAIFGLIMSDIQWSMELNYRITRIPHYYHSSSSNFNCEPLRNKLIEFRESLLSSPPQTYIELENSISQLSDEICLMAAAEYERVHCKRAL